MAKESSNNFQIEFGSDEDLAAYFADKELGHTCRLVIEFQLNQKDSMGASGTIEGRIEPEGGYDGADKSDDDESDDDVTQEAGGVSALGDVDMKPSVFASVGRLRDEEPVSAY